MAWVKLDDQFPDHPKIERAGERAAWLFICGLCYCAEHLTDGRIPASKATRLASGAPSRVAALIREGLWVKDGDEYVIPGYLDYQPTAEKVKADRAEVSRKRAEAGRRGAAARWQPDGNGDGKPDGNEMAPSPSPSLVNTSQEREPTAAAPTLALSLLVPKHHQSHAAELDGILATFIASHGVDALDHAVQAVSDRLGATTVRYPSDVKNLLAAELGPAPATPQAHPLDDAQRAQMAAAAAGLDQVRAAINDPAVEQDPAARRAVIERQRSNRGAA